MRLRGCDYAAWGAAANESDGGQPLRGTRSHIRSFMGEGTARRLVGTACGGSRLAALICQIPLSRHIRAQMFSHSCAVAAQSFPYAPSHPPGIACVPFPRSHGIQSLRRQAWRVLPQFQRTGHLWSAASSADLQGELAIAPRRLLAYCACLLVAIASLLLNTGLAPIDRSSLSSLLLLAVIYLPLVFVICGREGTISQFSWSTRMFSDVALFCALAGIVQFYAQFVIHRDWLFDFTPYLPTVLQGSGTYNTVIPIGYQGSGV